MFLSLFSSNCFLSTPLAEEKYFKYTELLCWSSPQDGFSRFKLCFRFRFSKLGNRSFFIARAPLDYSKASCYVDIEGGSLRPLTKTLRSTRIIININYFSLFAKFIPDPFLLRALFNYLLGLLPNLLGKQNYSLFRTKQWYIFRFYHISQEPYIRGSCIKMTCHSQWSIHWWGSSDHYS